MSQRKKWPKCLFEKKKQMSNNVQRGCRYILYLLHICKIRYYSVKQWFSTFLLKGAESRTTTSLESLTKEILTVWVRHGYISRRDTRVAACDMAWSYVTKYTLKVQPETFIYYRIDHAGHSCLVCGTHNTFFLVNWVRTTKRMKR